MLIAQLAAVLVPSLRRVLVIHELKWAPQRFCFEAGTCPPGPRKLLTHTVDNIFQSVLKEQVIGRFPESSNARYLAV
jgi:hypothetical protein